MSKEIQFYPLEIDHHHPKPIEFLGLNALMTIDQHNSFVTFNFKEDTHLNEESKFVSRLKQGYSLNIERNLQILINESDISEGPGLGLMDFWEYIHKCEKYKDEKLLNKEHLLPDPCQGFFNILKPVKEGEFPPKVSQLLNNKIYENKERLSVLKICGWGELEFYKKEGNSNLDHILKELLEKEQHFRAAAIAVFHFSFDKALDILNSIISNKNNKNEKFSNEVHYLRGVLSGFYNIQEIILRDYEITSYFFIYDNLNDLRAEDNGDMDFANADTNDDNTPSYLSEVAKIKNKKQKIDMLKNTLNFLQNLAKKACFKQPYLHLTTSFLSQELFNPKSFLQNNLISFYDRIALLIRFFPPSDILEFMETVSSNLHEGFIEHMVLFGNKFEASLQIISSYLDKTRDIQTVGLASCHLRFLLFPQEAKLNDWFKIYKDLLNRLEVYEIRAALDKEAQDLKKLIVEKEKGFKGVSLSNDDMDISLISQRCFYCFCSLSHSNNIGSSKKGYATLSRVDKSRILNCPDCLKPLPNCAICLLPVSILNPYLDDLQRKKNKNSDENPDLEILNIDEALVWCQSCRHGGHYKHIIEWFREYPECPVSDCQCECSML